MSEVNEKKSGNILVPVDFSGASEKSFVYAESMFDFYDGDIILIHVLEESFLSGLFSSKENRQLVMDGAENKMKEMEEQIISRNPKAQVRTIIKEGKPAKTIIETAKEEDCEVIVMGHGGPNSGLERIMGGTMSKIVRSSPIPIVIVKKKRSKPKFENIVLPLDLSKESKQKVSNGIQIARKYNSHVHVIMEIEGDEFLMNKVKANLLNVENQLKADGIAYTSSILSDQNYPGNFGQDIIQYADEVKADLILLMTQQESGLNEFFLGSHAQKIINNSQDTPIMCIQPRDLGVNYYGTEGFY